MSRTFTSAIYKKLNNVAHYHCTLLYTNTYTHSILIDSLNNKKKTEFSNSLHAKNKADNEIWDVYFDKINFIDQMFGIIYTISVDLYASVNLHFSIAYSTISRWFILLELQNLNNYVLPNSLITNSSQDTEDIRNIPMIRESYRRVNFGYPFETWGV